MELEAIKDIVVDEVENRGSWHGPGEQSKLAKAMKCSFKLLSDLAL